jgi:hypothetical protein
MNKGSKGLCFIGRRYQTILRCYLLIALTAKRLPEIENLNYGKINLDSRGLAGPGRQRTARNMKRGDGALAEDWRSLAARGYHAAMKNSFTISINRGSTIIGIEPGSTFTISGGGNAKEYSAPIEKVHAALSRWHAKEHPTGRKRRRFSRDSEELRAARQRGLV